MASIRRPTGVVGTCANGYLEYTGTWDNLLSPTEKKMGGSPIQENSRLSDDDSHQMKRNAIDSRCRQVKETKRGGMGSRIRSVSIVPMRRGNGKSSRTQWREAARRMNELNLGTTENASKF